jgi:hypothetical protein
VTFTVRYQPGGALLLAGPAVLALTTDASLGLRLWPRVRGGQDVQAVLAEALGDGLADLSDLVLVEGVDGHTRVLVRGPHVVNVVTETGDDVSCSGRDVATWTERVYADAATVGVTVAGELWLPLVSGAVLAGGFELDRGTQVGRAHDEDAGSAGRSAARPPLTLVPPTDNRSEDVWVVNNQDAVPAPTNHSELESDR